MQFDTRDAPTPALGLELYCAICDDWAGNILAGRSVARSYPIPVPPTPKLATQLLGILDFVRTEMIPRARTFHVPDDIDPGGEALG